MDLLIPTLAEPLPRTKVEKLLSDDNWRAEPKVDGDRLLIHVDNGNVTPVNRKGEITTIPSGDVRRAFASLVTGQWVFDGESVGHEFYMWDMPLADSVPISPDMPYEKRRASLESFFEHFDFGESVHLVVSHRDEVEKRALLDRVKAHGGEGIMLKDINAPYYSGKRTDRIRKMKLWKSCEVIITEKGREGKDNAVMEMICPGNCTHPRCTGRIEVGTISTIGKGSIQVGDVVEVKFLYSVNRDKPKLVQPTIMKVRTDKSFDECTIDQLDTCFTNKSVVEVVG